MRKLRNFRENLEKSWLFLNFLRNKAKRQQNVQQKDHFCDDIRFRQIFAKSLAKYFDNLRLRQNLQTNICFREKFRENICFPNVVAKICVRQKQLRVTALK
jgi:hypothetical protein